MAEYHEWMRIAKATRGTVCRAQTAYFLQLARVAKRSAVLSRADAQLIQRALSSVPATGDVVQAVCAIDNALAK